MGQYRSAVSQVGLSGVLVIAASVAFDGPRLSEQHLACALSADHDVLYLDPPAPAWSRANGFRPGRQAIPGVWSVSEVGPRLTRATLTVPPGCRRPLLLPLLDRWRTARARRLLAHRNQRATAILSAAGRPSVFIGFPDARRVFWAKDDYVAGAGLLGMDAARIAAGQDAVGGVVDAAVAVTPGLLAHWATRVPQTLLIPAGSDPAMTLATQTTAPASDLRLPRPIAGFVGQVSDRIDLGLLEAVADTGASLLLVGRRQSTFSESSRFAGLVARTNVQWVGGRSYEELPSYLAAIDVGLIPYCDSDFNRASFPLKLLEYLSAGAAVVTTDLPAARWLASSEVAIVTVGDFAPTVTRELAFAAAGGPALDARREARRSAAADHRWSRRAKAFAGVLGAGG